MLRSLPNSRRAKRHGEVGKVWQVDETYIRVEGKWCYLYRTLDSDENLLDSMLRQKQDMDERRSFWGRWIKDCPQTSNDISLERQFRPKLRKLKCNLRQKDLHDRRMIW